MSAWARALTYLVKCLPELFDLASAVAGRTAQLRSEGRPVKPVDIIAGAGSEQVQAATVAVLRRLIPQDDPKAGQ